jgi:hypothetical protein
MPPFVWTRSVRRTIWLWDSVQSAPRGRPATPLPLRWPDKTAAEILDYSLDASALLTGPTDSIALTVNATGSFNLLTTAVHCGIATLWLSGGIAGADGLVDLTLTAISGRRVHRIVRLFTS